MQTQNPDIVPLIARWWRKYLGKIKTELEEGELLKFVSCFKPDAEHRLFVLMDNKKEIHGFCTVYLDTAYNSLFIMQVATDKQKEMHKELSDLANKVGATGIFFATERNPKAWQRLLRAKQVGFIMELPTKEA